MTQLKTLIISSAYGVNLDSRMLDKILYVIEKNVMPLNYYSLVYHPSYKQAQRLFPLLRQFLFIPNGINNFIDFRLR